VDSVLGRYDGAVGRGRLPTMLFFNAGATRCARRYEYYITASSKSPHALHTPRAAPTFCAGSTTHALYRYTSLRTYTQHLDCAGCAHNRGYNALG